MRGHDLCCCCSGSDAHADTCATAGVGGSKRHRLRGGELCELIEVANDVHTDALVERTLQILRQRDVFNHELRQLQTQIGEGRLHVIEDLLLQHGGVRRHVEILEAAVGEDVSHPCHDGVAQLVFEFE